MVFTKQMGSAMAAAVTRANNDPDYLRQRIADQDAEIERLKQIIRDLKPQRIEQPKDDRQFYNGRPVITPTEAAQQCRVSKSTVSRYLESGHWEGVQIGSSNRWLVYTDRGLPVKQRGRRK